MTIEAFVATAWKDHADRPEEVADRLAGALAQLQTPADIPPYAQLVTHVFGEHLARWDAGIDLLVSLRELPCGNSDPQAGRVIDRNIASLRYAGGADGAVTHLSLDDRIAALATAGSALAGRHEFQRAIAAYEEALRLALPGLQPGSPALRAMAVAGNNLAASLEEKPKRDAGETRGMVAAAEGGLKYWKLAGTWLEHERAEYRLARSLLQADAAARAVEAAQRCVDVCDANDAPAIERFFAAAVLAVAQRRAGDRPASDASRHRALDQYAMIAPDDRQWCDVDRRELDDLDPIAAQASEPGPAKG
jgi:hypothetical protein